MQPTAPELEILKQLWEKSPLTAREIHNQLEDVLCWSYSSTRKTLERMQTKAFIAGSSEGNKIRYAPLADKVTTLAAFAQDFAQRIFELKSPLPVAMFADSQLINEHDIKQLEQLLKKLQANGGGK
jgi:Predicted transcriptional regulator